MSLKAKIEAVIYAAEEPVTLAQLAGIFAREIEPASVAEPEDEASAESESAESLIERGFVEASNPGADGDLMELALLQGQQERGQGEREHAVLDPAAAEAETKRVARQRDREVREQLKATVDVLIQEYATGDRGMEIREVAGGYRIATKPEYHDAVRSFIKSLKPPMKLSLQALETLAVIAYKQPVTAPEVSEIRGVDSGGVLGSLVSRKLITTAGRKQVIGRPILYKTTREFLLRFGLKDVNELPSIEEFEKLAGDLEIGDESESPQAANLPFDENALEVEAMEHNEKFHAAEAVEANAGEAGVAVVVEPEAGIPADSDHQPETVALDAASPEPAGSQDIEVTPPTTVPFEEIEDDNGRRS